MAYELMCQYERIVVGHLQSIIRLAQNLSDDSPEWKTLIEYVKLTEVTFGRASEEERKRQLQKAREAARKIEWKKIPRFPIL